MDTEMEKDIRGIFWNNFCNAKAIWDRTYKGDKDIEPTLSEIAYSFIMSLEEHGYKTVRK